VPHIVHHLAPMGHAGIALADGSMSSNEFGEGEIRKAVVASYGMTSTDVPSQEA
jgi:type I restriction enzyme M protein